MGHIANAATTGATRRSSSVGDHAFAQRQGAAGGHVARHAQSPGPQGRPAMACVGCHARHQREWLRPGIETYVRDPNCRARISGEVLLARRRPHPLDKDVWVAWALRQLAHTGARTTLGFQARNVTLQGLRRDQVLLEGLGPRIRHPRHRAGFHRRQRTSGLRLAAVLLSRMCLQKLACNAIRSSSTLGHRATSSPPSCMRPERTFWEKATANHVFCAQGSFRARRTGLDRCGAQELLERSRVMGCNTPSPGVRLPEPAAPCRIPPSTCSPMRRGVRSGKLWGGAWGVPSETMKTKFIENDRLWNL